jgi:hypothetical protein
MVKSELFAEGGKLHGALHDTSNRVITSAVITCIMLLVATGLSFFLPMAIVLVALFAPGVLTFALGGIPSRRHYMYQLSTNQRLAIQRYMDADDETKKMFPRDWINTVRSASTTQKSNQQMDEDFDLAVAAQKIIDVSKKRQKVLGTGNDKVVVALKMIEENVDMMQRDIKDREEVAEVDDMPKTVRRMVGRKIVEEPNPLYGRKKR